MSTYSSISIRFQNSLHILLQPPNRSSLRSTSMRCCIYPSRTIGNERRPATGSAWQGWILLCRSWSRRPSFIPFSSGLISRWWKISFQNLNPSNTQTNVWDLSNGENPIPNWCKSSKTRSPGWRFWELKRICKLYGKEVNGQDVAEQTKAILGSDGGEEESGRLWRLWRESLGWGLDDERERNRTLLRQTAVTSLMSIESAVVPGTVETRKRKGKGHLLFPGRKPRGVGEGRWIRGTGKKPSSGSCRSRWWGCQNAPRTVKMNFVASNLLFRDTGA